jgi:hypothetical protein
MKHIDIGDEPVSYYIKDEEGATINTSLDTSDTAMIGNEIDRGKERGKFNIYRTLPGESKKSELTVYWQIEY